METLQQVGSMDRGEYMQNVRPRSLFITLEMGLMVPAAAVDEVINSPDLAHLQML